MTLCIFQRCMSLILFILLMDGCACLMRCPGRSPSVPLIGFGTYRVDSNHESALLQGIVRGMKLIDTSANYMNGKAEEARLSPELDGV